MREPGSFADIPETTDVVFQEVWDRTNPGTKRKLAYLQLSNGRRLTVFPHQEWDAPLGKSRQVVLYPVRNAAVAAPVGGIPATERALADQVEGTSADYADGRENRSTIGPEPSQDIKEAAKVVDAAFVAVDESMNRLNDALHQLMDAVEEPLPS